MAIIMKKLFTILFLFSAITGFSASPSFQDFNTRQFSTNGNKMALTNNHMVTVWPNGTNDQAALQAAFLKGGIVELYPAFYYASNLVYTNWVHIRGNGAQINMLAGATGYLVDPASNGTNIAHAVFENLTLDGGSTIDYSTGALLQWPIHWPDLDSTFTNRSGMRFNSSGGGAIIGCTFSHFPGFGLFLENTNANNAYLSTVVKIVNSEASHNLIGVAPRHWGFSQPSSGTQPGYNAEYTALTGIRVFKNGVGIDAQVANHNVTGCEITGNFVGILVGYNGLVTANTINHNSWGVYARNTDTGEQIVNNVFLANSFGNFFDAARGTVFGYNTVWFSVTNYYTNTLSSPIGWGNYVIGNRYQGDYGTGFKVVNNWQENQLFVRDNYSLSNTNDTDGSFYFTIPAFQATGTVTTNIASGSDVPLTFSNAVYNAASGYSTANSTFTAPKPGSYYFKASVYVAANAASTGVFLYKNGSSAYRLVQLNTYAGFTVLSGSVVLTLAAGDTVKVYMNQNSGGDLALIGATSAPFGTYFEGRWLSP